MKLWVKIVIGMSVLFLFSLIFLFVFARGITIDEGSKECLVDEDCVFLTEAGSCDAGCYNKEERPIVLWGNTGGKCFKDPVSTSIRVFSCKCSNNKCNTDFSSLKRKASPYNPIQLSSTVKISAGKQKTMDISFYNARPVTATNAKFKVTSCLNKGNFVVSDKIPEVESVSKEVSASTSMDYEIKITENGLIPDTYICTLSVVNSNEPEMIYESKQFFLKVNE